MDLEWDEGKRQWTLETRGMDFADVEFFKFDTADTIADRRTDYGEVAWFPLATYMAAYASLLDRTRTPRRPCHFIEESQ